MPNTPEEKPDAEIKGAGEKSDKSSCKKRDYETPVAWLLGRQLMGSLKGTLLYTAFGNKIDPRDWMDARAFKHNELENGKEFWFDYIADTGDGMRSTYSMAYLCQSDLWVKQLWDKKPDDTKEVDGKYSDAAMRLKKEENPAEPKKSFTTKLPRGKFLMVGGDTTYHLADYTTLVNRFQTPFKWAHEDLVAANSGHEITPRPLYGIPGNHDYYDLLDGFRRQFRKPSRPDKENPDDPTASAQLIIPGYSRRQEASYLALELPWDWWLWGLDTELGAIDNRQGEFFKDKNEEKVKGKTPSKLIVATCAPTTVFGRYARWEDKKSAQTFFQLNLPWFFWSGNKKQKKMKREIREAFAEEPPDERAKNKYKTFRSLLPPVKNRRLEMPAGQCRLDLSGDIHLYARYWGPETDRKETGRKETDPKRTSQPPSCDHYASVVSGSGSAFHHPSYTTVDELQEQVLYPHWKTSLKAVADLIFNPFNIWRGGSIWLLGFIIAFVIYFGATVPTSSKQAFDELLTIAPKSISGAFNLLLTTIYSMLEGLSGEKAGKYWGIILLVLSLGLIGIAVRWRKTLFGIRPNPLPAESKDWTTKKVKDKLESERNRIKSSRKLRLWGFVLLNIFLVAVGFHLLRQVRDDHLTAFESSILVLYSLLLGAAAFYFCIEYSEWLFEQTRTDYVTKSDWRLVHLVSLCGVIGVASGLWYFGRKNLPVYVLTDILFILVIVLSFGGITALAYFKGGEMLENGWDKFKIFIVGVFHALLQIAFPFLMIAYGTVLSLVLAIVTIIAAIYIGRWAMREDRRIALTLMWIIYGGIMLFLPLRLQFSAQYQYLPSPESLLPDSLKFLTWSLSDSVGWILPKFWEFLTGVLVSLTEFLINILPDSLKFSTSVLPKYSANWEPLFLAILAGSIGAFMSCVWFAWYLAVCFLNFQGHNNEIGGAARIENYKQFIRFRLTEDSLTGYVIAVDDVSRIGEPLPGRDRGSKLKSVDQKDGRWLEPKLIDVFRLTVKKPAADEKKAESASENISPAVCTSGGGEKND